MVCPNYCFIFKISMIGLRRPATDFERDAMMHLRQRARSARAHALTSFISSTNTHLDSHSVDKAFVPDNVLRFCGEDVINFGALEAFPTKVRESSEDFSDRNSSATLSVSVC